MTMHHPVPDINSPSIFLSTALRLFEFGQVAVLLRPRDKIPVMGGFQNWWVASGKDDLTRPAEMRITRAVLERWARDVPMANVGLLCGDIIGVDIDLEAVWPHIADLLPRNQVCKRGRKGWTLFYRNDPADPVRRTRTFTHPETGDMVLEVLAHGRQTVMPPSIHPETQQPYRWVSNPWGDPAAGDLGLVIHTLSQRQVDAIQQRLIERGYWKPKPLGHGGNLPLGITIGEAERRRYAAFLTPKLVERLAAVRGAVKSTRRDTLNGAVYALAPWAREGFITEDFLEDELREACELNGWIGDDGHRAFARQFNDALKDGWNRPLPDLDNGRADKLLGSAPAMPDYVAPTMYNAPGYVPPPADIEPRALAYQPRLSFTLFDGILPPEEPELIKHLLPATPGHLAFIAGPSGGGKTFCEVAIAVALATGRPFFGKPVRERVGSIIVASEGEGTLAARIWAAARAAGLENGNGLPIARIFRPGNLRTAADRERLIASIREASAAIKQEYGLRTGVTFLDTVQTNFALGEGRDGEVTEICGQIREIGFATQTAMAPLHHFGKDASQGMRGSTAWQDNADYMLICGAKIDRATGEISDRYLSLGKTRNDRMGPISKADLQSVDLGINQYNEPRASCVYVAIEGNPFASDSEPDLFEKVYDKLEQREGNDDGIPVAELKIQYLIDHHSANRNAKNTAFGRACTKMIREGLFVVEGDIWRRNVSQD